jgi:hypothetical protein
VGLRERLADQEAPTTRAAFGRRLDMSDAGEEARRRLEAAEVLVSNPNLVNYAIMRFSSSYSDNLRVMQRVMKQARVAATAAEVKYSAYEVTHIWAEASGLSVADAREAYRSPAHPPRESIATEVYLVYLTRTARSAGAEAPQAQGLLEKAKDMVLGGENQATSSSVIPYHPIQAMGVVCGPARSAKPIGARIQGSPPAELVAQAVDLSLPQSKTVVFYDPSALIDLRSANRFGPLAMTVSGLNFTIIQRFQTIREKPVRRAGSTPAPGTNLVSLPTCQDGPLSVSLDAGETLASIGAPDSVGPRWNPSGGPRPRVPLYGSACADVIQRENPNAPQQGPDLMAELEQLQTARDEKMAVPTETVKRAIRASFVAAYDKAFPDKPPTDSTEILDLLNASPSYVLAGLMTAARVKDTILFPSLAAADPRVHPKVTDREAWVTALVQASEIATEMRKKMRVAYWRNMPAFTKGMLAVKIREVVLEHFDRVVLPTAAETDSIQIIKTSAKVLMMVSDRTD